MKKPLKPIIKEPLTSIAREPLDPLTQERLNFLAKESLVPRPKEPLDSLVKKSADSPSEEHIKTLIKKPIPSAVKESLAPLPKVALTSLAEVEAEQAKLKLTIELTRQELVRSVASSKDIAREFVIRKIAIPVGVAGLGVAAANTAINSFSDKDKGSKLRKKPGLGKMDLMGYFFPIALNFIQAYFMKEQKEEIERIKKPVMSKQAQKAVVKSVT